MARNPRRVPLYEVIRGRRLKSGPDRSAGQLPETEGQAESPDKPQVPQFVWPRRPKSVRFDGQRLEISVPYQLAVAVALAVVVLVLLAFRLGQWRAKTYSQPAAVPEKLPLAPPLALPPVQPENVAAARPRAVTVEPSRMIEPRRDHRIVIQQYRVQADLVPVQKYFAEYNIETEIQQRAGVYFLVTTNPYENPEKPGTDGYAMKQKIIQLGKGYKAQPGYETFAPNLFGDAYGEKVR